MMFANLLLSMIIIHNQTGYKFEVKVVSAFTAGIRQDILVRKILTTRAFLEPDAAVSFDELVAVAARDGVNIVVNSSFRTYIEQINLYRHAKRMCRIGYRKYCGLAAKPGYSTHQQGISIDIAHCVLQVGPREFRKLKPDAKNIISQCPKRRGTYTCVSKVYKWLSQNASRYGFYNDVSSEPWHWTFIENKQEGVFLLNK